MGTEVENEEIENEVQETEEVEATEEKTEKKTLEDLSPEEVIDYARKQGKEAAKYRTERNTLKAEVERLKPFEEETLTEKEKLEAKINDLNSELAPIRTAKAQKAAAVAAGLDLSYAELVSGDTDEDRRASAELLAAKLPKPGETEEKPKGDVFSGEDYFGGREGKAPIKGTSGEPWWKNPFN